MGYFTMIFRVGIVTAGQMQGMFKTTNIDKAQIEGKKDRARHQPNNNQGQLRAKQWNFKKNNAGDNNGEGLNRSINKFVDAFGRVSESTGKPHHR